MARKQKIPLEWWETGVVKKNTCSVLQKGNGERPRGRLLIFQTWSKLDIPAGDSGRWSRKTESYPILHGTEAGTYYTSIARPELGR